MLKECINIRQIKGERKRRWFSNDYFDLIVWFDEGLFYEDEKIFGSHNRISSGEYGGLRMKESPILVQDGFFQKREIAARFLKESAELDPRIRIFILRKIKEYKWI